MIGPHLFIVSCLDFRVLGVPMRAAVRFHEDLRQDSQHCLVIDSIYPHFKPLGADALSLALSHHLGSNPSCPFLQAEVETVKD